MSRGDRAGEALADSPCYPARPRRLCRSSADGGRAGDSCPGQRPPPPPFSLARSLAGCGAREPLTARASRRRGRGAAAASGPCCRGARGARSEASGWATLPPERGPRPRRLRCRGLRRDTRTEPPGQDRCGLRLPAAPPTASGSARGSAGRTRDTRPPRRATPPPPALPSGSAPLGGGIGWERAFLGPAAGGRALRSPPLHPLPASARAVGCARGGFCAPCPPPRARRWGQRGGCSRRRLRGGPGGEEFPQLHA